MPSLEQQKPTDGSLPASRGTDGDSDAAMPQREHPGHALQFEEDPTAGRGDGDAFVPARTKENTGGGFLEGSKKQALPAALGMSSDHLLGVDPSLLQRLTLDVVSGSKRRTLH